MTITKWAIDPTHSEIGFKVKHMMFTNVSGKFQEFDAIAETEEDDFGNTKFEFSAKVDSLTTGNTDRDAHLLSPDFFDTENHPLITFFGNATGKSSSGNYELTGDLTIRGITKPILLNAEYVGTATDPWGNLKAAFSISGKINRKDWGLNWNSALETGGVLVGEEVRLTIELQFTKQ